MKYLLSKNSKSLELRGSFKLNKAIESLAKYFKKLVALSLLATLAITTGACDSKKTNSTTETPKTKLKTLGIDESKAFFVTETGTKNKDCTTWQNACDLQSAIDKAEKDTTKKFVLVAQGSYYTDPERKDINKNFILKDEVKIYGGFDVNAKKLTRYKDASILEGKLSSSLYSKQILTGENLSATSILDGFLIQNALNADNGNGTDAPKNYIKAAALFLNNSSPKLNNLTFNNNKLTGSYSTGGAIYNDNKSKPSISNSSFNNNFAKEGSGGAIYNNNSSPSISKTSFSNNSANYGGAIYNRDNSNPSISKTSFSNNSTNYGGAIYNRGNSSPSISNNSFSNNSAAAGGAIYNRDNSSPSISNNSFSNNSAAAGGAIYNDNKSKPSISNSTFNNNSAKNHGGDIYNHNSSPSISNSTFSNNSANYGGAISNNSSNPSISNSSFSDNSALHGGAIFNDNKSSPSISNSSFSNNSAKWGGAIFNYNKSSPKIYNSILWNNRDKHKGSEAINSIYNFDATSQPIIKNSILNADSAVAIKNGQSDLSKTDSYNFMNFNDTKFKDNQAPATFSIDVRGKVANANQALIKYKGDNALYLQVYDKIKGNPANTTTTIPSDDKDLAGNPRLQGSKIDIGAYEIQD